MGMTIGRRIPRRQNIRGNAVAMCDQCGAHYYLTQLVKKPGGALLCIGPGTCNDAKGLDEFELGEGNAQGAWEYAASGVPIPANGGNFDDDNGL